MSIIAYATDLHISHATRQRADALALKMAKVRTRVNAFFLGGDTFTLHGAEHWDALVKRPANVREIAERTRYSVELAQELIPGMIDAAGGRPIFMTQGNADALSFYHIMTNAAQYPGLRPIFGGPFEFEGLRIIGIGGMEANDPGSMDVLRHNPWYEGVLSPAGYSEKLDVMLRVTRLWNREGWRRAILMTHQPAYGYVDTFWGVNNGSHLVGDFVRKTYPMLHLCGHVHDGPTLMNMDREAKGANKEYRFERTRAVIDGQTLSVNPGGGDNHDPDIRMVLIDLEKLAGPPNDPSEAVEQV